MSESKTTLNIPDGWHVSWMGRDKSDGMFIAQLRCDDDEIRNNDRRSTFVSRTGITWFEALTTAILVIEKEEIEYAQGI